MLRKLWRAWRIYRLEVRQSQVADAILRWRPGEATDKTLREWQRLSEQLAILKEDW